MVFRDRIDAGEQLARILSTRHPEFINNPHVVVLGIPRGGVVVAAQVSKALRVPLDAAVVRKLGVPYHPEFAFGAIDAAGGAVINTATVSSLGLEREDIEGVKEKELAEAQRREKEFRGGREPLELTGKTAIVVDDGVATGATVEAAIKYVLSKGASEVVLATPVIAADTLENLRNAFHELLSRNDTNFEIVCLDAPEFFAAVGQFYVDFPQTSDEEVKALLGL